MSGSESRPETPAPPALPRSPSLTPKSRGLKAPGGGVRRPWPGRSEGLAWRVRVRAVLGHLLSSPTEAPICLGPSGPEAVNKKDVI